MIDHKNLIYWLQLSMAGGVTKAVLKSFFDCFGAKPQKIIEHLKERAKKHSKELVLPEKSTIEKEIDQTIKYGAEFITPEDELYPPLLQEINSAPMVLIAKGNKKALAKNSIAIIGTRMPTIPSINFTKKISAELAQKDWTIVSGMAQGIDGAAHQGALECGSTIGVIGSGINHQYPIENKKIYQLMLEKEGLILTEFPFNTPPISHHFPQRNRIIAGLSSGTIVVEAKTRSGSLITAEYARSFNREVYVVPGFASDARYSGGNELIKKQIAKLIDCAQDVIDDLTPEISTLQEDRLKMNYQNMDNAISIENGDHLWQEAGKLQEEILAVLSSTETTKDEIISHLSHLSTPNIIMASLIELELCDKIIKVAGGGFVLSE